MKCFLIRIFTLIVLLSLGKLNARAADLEATPALAPLAGLVPVVAPVARCAAVSDLASVLVFGHRPTKDKPGELSIFGVDAQGAVVGTPVPPAPLAPPGSTPPKPLFTVVLPRAAALATFPNAAACMFAHPKLPLLYVWQDIDGPPMTSAKDNVVFKEFDHLLIYSLAAGQPPKLEVATARGPGFMYGVGGAMLAMDSEQKRLLLPGLRSLASADAAANAAVGYLKLDEHGMPVKEGEKLAIVSDDILSPITLPGACGCVFASPTVAVFGGAYGPTTWDAAGRRAKFNSYWTALPPGTQRLIGHPTLPVVYISSVTSPIVWKMEHAEGYVTMQAQRLSITGTTINTPGVLLEKQNKIAFGTAGKIYVANLDKGGNYAAPVTFAGVDNPSVEALAYSVKFDRLYVSTEKKP